MARSKQSEDGRNGLSLCLTFCVESGERYCCPAPLFDFAGFSSEWISSLIGWLPVAFSSSDVRSFFAGYIMKNHKLIDAYVRGVHIAWKHQFAYKQIWNTVILTVALFDRKRRANLFPRSRRKFCLLASPGLFSMSSIISRPSACWFRSASWSWSAKLPFDKN